MPPLFPLVRGFLAVCLVSTGCGYHFLVEGPGPTLGRTLSPVPEGPPLLVTIDPVENRTFEPNLEMKYTEYLAQEFRLVSGITVVNTPQEADYVLSGAIESVSLPSLTFTQSQTQESRVAVDMAVQLTHRRTGKVVWTQRVRGTAEFFVGGAPTSGGGTASLQFNRVLQDRALEQAGQSIAEDIVDRLALANEQGLFGPSGTSTGMGNPPDPPASLPPADPQMPNDARQD